MKPYSGTLGDKSFSVHSLGFNLKFLISSIKQLHSEDALLSGITGMDK